MLTVYKPGQGFWTRVLSGVGGGILAVTCGAWFMQEAELLDAVSQSEHGVYIRWGVFLAVMLVVGVVLWWALNKPSVVDFMIATEGEMRKVNWPTRKDLVGSTWVVICGTLMLAVLLFVIDLAFAKLFQVIGVLQGGG